MAEFEASFADLGAHPPSRPTSSYLTQGRALILEGAVPSGWHSLNPGTESSINVIIRGVDPLDKISLPYAYEGLESELAEAYELITSSHALRNTTMRSDAYIQEDNERDNKLLQPMFTAAQAAFTSEARKRGEDPSQIQFSLKPHQRDGVGMMRQFENGKYRGCLLGDDMGLGKTAQILALYLVNPVKGPMLVVAPASILDNWIQEIKRFLNLSDRDVFVYRGDNIKNIRPGVFERSKIVLTSFNRLLKEEASLESTVKNFEAIRYDPGTTHRPNPKNTKNRTYPAIRASTLRPQIPLLTTDWGRVVLDEGHAIRNKKTVTFRGASRLRARTRILVTGTPFANEYSDVQSLFEFLRIPPFDRIGFFKPYFLNKKINRKNDRIQIPVLPHMRNAVLYQALQAIMVRRMKTDEFEGHPVVQIPAPEYITINLRLDNGSHYPFIKCYDGDTMPPSANTFKILTRVGLFFSWLQSGARSSPSATLLQPLLPHEFIPFSEQSTQFESRLQWCNRLRTVKNKRLEKSRKTRKKAKPRKKTSDDTPEVTMMLQGSMYAAHWAAPRARYAFHDEDDDLAGLHDDLLDPLERQELLLAGKNLSQQLHRRQEFLGDAKEGDFWKSTKLEQTLKIIQDRLAEDDGKIIVFCFSLVVLDLMTIGLTRCGIRCLRYDGSVPKEKRFPIINEFQSAAGARVILITSGSGGVGLNLFAASTVIVICPEWSPAKDDQLIGRAYRMGQKKTVKIYRLIADYSMDQRVQEVQELKNDKRNALLDLFKTDGISTKEAQRRGTTLATVDRLKNFDLREFQRNMAEERVENKHDDHEDEMDTDVDSTTLGLSPSDSDEEQSEQATESEFDTNSKGKRDDEEEQGIGNGVGFEDFEQNQYSDDEGSVGLDSFKSPQEWDMSDLDFPTDPNSDDDFDEQLLRSISGSEGIGI